MAAVRKSWASRAIGLTLSLVGSIALMATAQQPQRSSEFRLDYKPAAYAIKGAKVHASPELTIESGTVVVRSGLIEAVGPADSVTIPYDAEVIDGKGLHVYPGFIDAYTTLGVPTDAVRSASGGGRTVPYGDFAYPRTPEDNRNAITPEFQTAAVLDLPESTVEERRGLGFTDLVAAPGGSIAAGQSALASLSGLPRREVLLKAPLSLHVAFRGSGGMFGEDAHDDDDHSHEAMAQLPGFAPQTPSPTPTPGQAPAQAPTPSPATRRGAGGGGGAGYPNSLMGQVAHFRQAMLDSEHAQAVLQAYLKGHGPRPASDPALSALHSARTKALPVWWEANTRDEIHRALDLAEEFGTTATIVGGHDAAKVADRLQEDKVPVVLRLDFGDEPKTPSEAEYRKKPIDDREEPLKALIHKHTSWKERTATAKALHEAGVKFALASDAVGKADTFHAKVRQAIAAGLPREAAVQALTRDAAEIVGMSERLGTIEKGKLDHVVAWSGPYGEEASKVRYVLADGLKFDLSKPQGSASPGGAAAGKKSGRGGGPPNGKAEARKVEPQKDEPKTEPQEKTEPKKDEPKTEPQEKAEPKKEEPKSEAKEKDEPKKDEPKTEAKEKDEPEQPAAVDPETEFDEDRVPRLKTGGDVLIKDVTILTVTRGTIPKGSILVRYGKIAAIGEQVEAPAGITVIDGTGLVAMPGIIDSHSHIAISGGVNEMSLSIVPEVRVKDVVRGDDVQIYRQSAGGVTAARLLHGSANTIGGQDAVIKLRYNHPARDLIVKDGPQGVKFALGENVTRSSGRFPNSRMGVEAVIERAFEEGRTYKALGKEYEARKAAEGEAAGAPPRRDLRLEALSQIVDGQIKIHSHCYRNDEMLMLLRTAERHGVKVQSLQHALEGYKIAAEIAQHGASVSTFSDWWAYKVEAYDAIPYNAALLTQAGVRTVIKSDSEELARHLYLEAAKIVKYGDVSEQQALEMITINPARQLGLDKRVGSIEVGKDADIAIFNGHPLDGFSRCELTLVEGEVSFERREPNGGMAARGGDAARLAIAPAEARTRTVDLAPSNDGSYALVGATLHPVSADPVPNGVLLIKDGKIAALGGADTPIPNGVKTVDLKGLDVWPGMIDAGNVVGLYEIASLRETQDASDTAQFQPELKASTALHPDSEIIPVTRANGITSLYVMPGGGSISGQGALVALDGWVPSEMVIVDNLAVTVNVPAWVSSDPDQRGRMFGQMSGGGDPARSRKDRIEAIKDQFKQALEYDRVMAEAAKRKQIKVPDPRMAALLPYAKGEKPVIFKADKRGEILDAIKIAQELKLKAIVSGGAEAWKVAEQLKAAKMPVLVAGTLKMPSNSADPYDAPYSNPARLHEAGVTFAIKSGASGTDTATSSRNLPFEAAMAVAYGLPEDEGVKAVTLHPAQVLGVADKLGSLDPGKRADLVITAGHLLQPTTVVKGLYLGGKPLKPESKHTRLYETYQGRLADVKAGKAKLGLDRPATPSPSPTPTPTAAPTGGDRR